MRHEFLLVCAVVLVCIFSSPSKARTFGDYECLDDCEGHVAGYLWADDHQIDDEELCPEGNMLSFHKGCLAYVADPIRGAENDDDGDPVGYRRR